MTKSGDLFPLPGFFVFCIKARKFFCFCIKSKKSFFITLFVRSFLYPLLVFYKCKKLFMQKNLIILFSAIRTNAFLF